MLGKLPVPGRPIIWITVGQGPIALAVGAGGGCDTVGQGPSALAVSAGGGCLEIFTLIYPVFPLSPSFWEMARYRLKYCLKGSLNPKQPTNQLLKKRISSHRSKLFPLRVDSNLRTLRPSGKQPQSFENFSFHNMPEKDRSEPIHLKFWWLSVKGITCALRWKDNNRHNKV